MRYGGALPMQTIFELIDGGFVVGPERKNVQPSSVDLIPTDEFYRVPGAFLPSRDETVEAAIRRVKGIRISEITVLERGACYVCRLKERIDRLPQDVYGYANPKSSSGRLDVHVRMLADKVSRYDSIPRGYKGPLWLLVSPKTFSIKVPIGIALNQIRFFNQDTRLDELRLETSFEQDGGFLIRPDGEQIRFSDIEHSDGDGSVILTLGLDFPVPGFEAVSTGEVIDLSLVKHYDPHDFFRPISVSHDSLNLAPNTFYILSTREYVRVPKKFACEMAPMDERSGELRSHYAGFIDPGWGIGRDGKSKGRPLTLEVRSFDNGLIIRNHQPIAKVRYERMIDGPTKHYGEMQSNYDEQIGPKLSKHFKPWS